MNTIKFSKINNIITEQHNLETINIKEINLFNQKIKLYEPCNLNIFITNICPNNCYFCINRTKQDDISDIQYFSFLEDIFKELQLLNIEITITGGEPSVNPTRLIRTMQLCKKYGFKCRTFSSTGLCLLDEVENKPICQYMIENNFIHNINISKMHWNEEKNKEILKTGISNKKLEKLNNFFKMNDASLRTSCNLIPQYIDSLNKIENFVSFYDDLGIESMIFREIVGNYNKININNIIKDIDNNKDYTYLETLEGIYYIVDIYQYHDYLVKVYKTKTNIDTTLVSSLSLNNNIFRVGFNGKILKKG